MLQGVMAVKGVTTGLVPAEIDETSYAAVLAGVSELLESARHAAARAVNFVMTATYWEVGRRIVTEEQRGRNRANYGEQLISRLAKDLTSRCGRGFGKRNLYQMRQFYMAYPQILQTASAEFRRKPSPAADSTLKEIGKQFPLSWSHYVRLLSVNKPEARAFYEAEALRGGWNVRQLDRQVSTDENPPVGLILCAEHRAGVAKYALEGLPNKVLAAEYRTTLPSEETLASELKRTRKMLEGRTAIVRKKP
jgi:hypothetical protein